MEIIFEWMNAKLDINGDAIFNGMDLALWPFLIGVYWILFWVLPQSLKK